VKPYNFVADSIHTNKLYSRLSLSEVDILHGKRPFCVFHPLESDNLRFIGKRGVDFLLVLTERFSQGVTAEALRQNIG